MGLLASAFCWLKQRPSSSTVPHLQLPFPFPSPYPYPSPSPSHLMHACIFDCLPPLNLAFFLCAKDDMVPD